MLSIGHKIPLIDILAAFLTCAVLVGVTHNASPTVLHTVLIVVFATLDIVALAGGFFALSVPCSLSDRNAKSMDIIVAALEIVAMIIIGAIIVWFIILLTRPDIYHP